MLEESSRGNVTIAGAGPAGVSLATELARRGHAVRVLDPAWQGAWRASYGSWERSLRGLGFDWSGAVSSRFARAVALGSAPSSEGALTLSEPYLRFDTAKLQSRMLECASEAGVTFESQRLDAAELPPGLIVDASGRGLWPASLDEVSFQTAYGVWLDRKDARSAGLELPEDSMCLMDYREVPGESRVPTFLYSMVEGLEGNAAPRIFLQETVLVSRRPVDFDFLRGRLVRRLRQQGVKQVESLLQGAEEERCLIPMGTPVRQHHERVLPFGAAAGMVQPATGYQLARTLRTAPLLAEFIATLDLHDAGEAARQAFGFLWPRKRRASWDLYRWGAATLARMSPQEMREFVDGFFRLPKSVWMPFMEGEQSPSEILQTMWGVFTRAPSLRWSLVKNSSASTNAALFGAFLEGASRSPVESRS